MIDSMAADVARVLAVLHDERAWFRHGLTDTRISELTGFSLARIVAARRAAAVEGLIEVRGANGREPMTLLTPLGVARVRPPMPAAKAEEPPGAA